MSLTAFLFPGQGAQHVGMGKGLYEKGGPAAELFDTAEAVTGLPIKRLCFEGPEEELTLTSNAQPCIFTFSAALLAAAGERLPRPDVCAGLSLGEYTALYAAGAFDFETGARLVARRGELMQQAATARASGMVAVIGLDEEQIQELCTEARQDQILTPANFNCPGQIVISGDSEACRRAAALAEEKFEARATILKVAGAFHSDIMAPAAEEFGKTLSKVSFADPQCRVVANVDTETYASAGNIPEKLLLQLTGAIRWQQSMEKIIAEGLETPYEIGPGKTLSGMMRRIDRGTRVTAINSAEAIDKVLG